MHPEVNSPAVNLWNETCYVLSKYNDRLHVKEGYSLHKEEIGKKEGVKGPK